MYNRTLSILFVTLALMLGSATTVSAAEGAAAKADPAPAQMVNPFDPATWGHMSHEPAMRFNFAHPSGWAVFIDPATHPAAHHALMNPATYAQFMQPQFWMQFANPNKWMAWMNPASYATFFNPATYMGWMRPEPYMHFMNPGMYMQWMNPGAYTPYMNPATYMQWMNPAAYAMPGTGGNMATFNWFDPSSWMGTTAPNSGTQQPPAKQ